MLVADSGHQKSRQDGQAGGGGGGGRGTESGGAFVHHSDLPTEAESVVALVINDFRCIRMNRPVDPTKLTAQAAFAGHSQTGAVILEVKIFKQN